MTQKNTLQVQLMMPWSLLLPPEMTCACTSNVTCTWLTGDLWHGISQGPLQRSTQKELLQVTQDLGDYWPEAELHSLLASPPGRLQMASVRSEKEGMPEKEQEWGAQCLEADLICPTCISCPSLFLRSKSVDLAHTERTP